MGAGADIVKAVLDLAGSPEPLAAQYAAVVVLRTAADLLLCEVSVDRLRGWADEIEQEVHHAVGS